eukprot:scaffold434_cov186-Pinguiococcus_pyrenoidosus.AAC.87
MSGWYLQAGLVVRHNALDGAWAPLRRCCTGSGGSGLLRGAPQHSLGTSALSAREWGARQTAQLVGRAPQRFRGLRFVVLAIFSALPRVFFALRARLGAGAQGHLGS